MSEFDFENDYGKNIMKLKSLAKQGDADAQFFLGCMYEEGKGLLQDIPKAIKWYSKAARQGVGGAQLKVGIMCIEGKVMPKNYKRAEKMFRMAGKNGFLSESKYLLCWISKEKENSINDLGFYNKRRRSVHVKAHNDLFESYMESNSTNLDNELIIERIKKESKNRKLLPKIYLLKKPREWQEEYPSIFFSGLDRLYGNKKTTSNNRPQYYAHFINKYVYEPLLKGEISKSLSVLNPIFNGIRKNRHHQFFDSDLGLKILRARIKKIINIMQVSADIKDFERRYNKLESNQLDIKFFE